MLEVARVVHVSAQTLIQLRNRFGESFSREWPQALPVVIDDTIPESLYAILYKTKVEFMDANSGGLVTSVKPDELRSMWGESYLTGADSSVSPEGIGEQWIQLVNQ